MKNHTISKSNMRNLASAKKQGGAALIVALIFLVALTVLGVAALDGNTLQQRMTVGLSENVRSFQAAESALAVAENWLTAQVVQPAPDCDPDATTSPCGTSNTAIWATGATPEINLANLRNEAWWTLKGRTYTNDYIDGGTPVAVSERQLANTAVQPAYVIEQLGSDNSGSLVRGVGRSFQLWYYQISAKGHGSVRQAPALVQSVFSRPF